MPDSQIARTAELLDKHHYLGAPNPGDERLWYAAIDPDDKRLGVLLSTVASR